MAKRQAGRSQATKQASQNGGWRSAEVKDDSKIFMATWEIADAGGTSGMAAVHCRAQRTDRQLHRAWIGATA